MDNQEIRIECEGSFTVSLDEIKELHHYKELTEEAYDKGHTSISQLGFSFPFFIWEDSEGTKWAIDGHMRKPILMRMRSEGWKVPELPAVRIFAKDRLEAKKKLLAQESQYGKIQEEGLNEFMNEAGYELDPGEVDTFVAINEFDYEYNQNQEEEKPSGQQSCSVCRDYHERNHQTEEAI